MIPIDRPGERAVVKKKASTYDKIFSDILAELKEINRKLSWFDEGKELILAVRKQSDHIEEIEKQLQENSSTLEQTAESLNSITEFVTKIEATEQIKQSNQVKTPDLPRKVKFSTGKYGVSFKSGRSLPPKS